MRGRLYLIGLLMLVILVSADAQQVSRLPSSGIAIRVSVDRVNIGVTVTDSHRHSVPGLRREDFQIFDNGAEQPIIGFVPNEEPAQLVFLIERSSADYLLAKLGKSPFSAADNLLNNISAIDRIAVVTYSSAPELVLDFTPDKLRARQVLQQINYQTLSLQSQTSSGWLNLSSSLAATIDWLASVPGSKIIVLLSSGIDTSPPSSWLLVQEKLKTCDVHILPLSILGDFRKPEKWKKLSPDDRANRLFVKQSMTRFDQELRELSETTGGHAYFPKNRKDFERDYSEIAQLVRGEYTLEFAPLMYDNQVHSIKVKVKHFRYHADYRQAYLAPPPSAH